MMNEQGEVRGREGYYRDDVFCVSTSYVPAFALAVVRRAEGLRLVGGETPAAHTFLIVVCCSSSSCD